MMNSASDFSAKMSAWPTKYCLAQIEALKLLNKSQQLERQYLEIGLSVHKNLNYLKNKHSLQIRMDSRMAPARENSQDGLVITLVLKVEIDLSTSVAIS